ncbi:hypothetical protein FD32_GL000916 [Limosilactobacillus panis DSM 6035]|uniref:NrS-1 polymerase-like HBD domain-containing protein n=2 Tax=Limosilactobacillus panis TaxID=47493 RepID=A0A0R1X4T5_9LACO|nr:hypothetical protein FD32_GL000916 [Limosilactobacillus panis DSM 6035]
MDFPEEMKNDRRWVAWFYEKNPQHPNSVHSRKKVPCNLNSYMCRGSASTIDPQTWATYQQAITTQNYADTHPKRVKVTHYGGPGFIIDDGWGFLDLDNIPTVIANHNLGERNQIDDILDLLDHTYCEASQSQSGLHFIFKVDDTVEAFNKHPEQSSRELYTSKRLVALTGNVLDPEEPLKITTIDQETWKQLNILVFGKYAPPIKVDDSFSDTELSHGVLSAQGKQIMYLILRGSDADQFNWWCTADLPDISTKESGKKFPDWNGELIYYDPSRQDMACCCMLAYWVRYYVGEYDSKLIDEIYKQTNLYRPKWNRNDGAGTYGQRTISRAIAYKQGQRDRKIEQYKGMIVHGEE